MQLRSHTDESLMKQVADGNRAALEVLIQRHASSLLSFVRRWVGDEHRSEEHLQEVFLSVWRHRHRYDRGRPFRPWLYRIALNRCREEHRKAVLPITDVSEPEAVLCAVRESGPIETAIASETSALVAAAVRCLPEKQRSVVSLRVWQGLSYAEVAEVLQCAEVTARYHMHEALSNLRKHLAAYVGEE